MMFKLILDLIVLLLEIKEKENWYFRMEPKLSLLIQRLSLVELFLEQVEWKIQINLLSSTRKITLKSIFSLVK